MVKLNLGDKAPVFSLPNALGKSSSLKDYLGKWVVIYFYPRDDTPGCTIEALDFSKLSKDFSKNNAVVIGISKDSCSSHQKFIDKHKLSVELLSDDGHRVQELFGVWGKKKFMGREFMGTIRSTFLINPRGRIAFLWNNVKAALHAQAVLEKVRELQ